MLRRPFYRSRLFWLGLLGLVFLLWAGWISTRLYFSAGFSGTGSMGMSLSGGEIVAHWSSVGWPDWRNFYADHFVLSPKERDDWRAGLATASEVSPTFHHRVFSGYMFVSGYAAGWLLVLVWWQRRKSRLLELHSVL